MGTLPPYTTHILESKSYSHTNALVTVEHYQLENCLEKINLCHR